MLELSVPVARQSQMPLRPFYRSRLFWLGLPGLVFLLWAWVDSYWHVSTAASTGLVKVEGLPARGPGYRLLLQEGRCVYLRHEVQEASLGAAIFRSPLSLSYKWQGVYLMNSSPWGSRTSVSEVMSAPGKVTLRTTERWFPFGFVVAGYAGILMGLLVMWRRWMKRRWEASRVVEG
jgi:hypothetical protein